MVHERIGGIAQHGHNFVPHHLTVQAVVDARRSGDDCLELGMTGCGLDHQRQVVADFPHARTGHEGDDGAVGKTVLSDETGKFRELFARLSHFLHGGVTHIGGLIAALTVPVGLEGQDAVHVVNIAADVLDTPLLPHPHLRRNEIVHGNAQIMGIFSDLEVKRRIIHKNQGIGLPLVDGTARSAQEAEDFAQVLHHIHKAHIGHVAEVDDGLAASLFGHQVATQEAELGLGIFLLERGHQMRGVQVARGLSGDDEVFHTLSRRFRVTKSNS